MTNVVDKTIAEPAASGDVVLGAGAPARAKNALTPSACGDIPGRFDDAAVRQLEHVNVAPAQTWNRLRANDISLTVPFKSRKGDVYFALPRLFESIECGMGPKVTEWVRSQAADARYVEVPARSKREEPIVVSVASGEVTDTGIMVREGAEVTVVVTCSSGNVAGGDIAAGAGGERGYTGAPSAPVCASRGPSAEDDAPACGGTSASLLRVIAEAGATVHLVEILSAAEDAQHLDSVGILAGKGARVDVRQYALGGGTVAMGLTADLAGDTARFDLANRYYAAETDALDINHVVRMRGRNTWAEIAESGILDDAAKKSLRTTIDLVHGAKGAKGNEAETVLVLGDDVVNKTVPTILCDEDDVAGNHGATIGSVSPEQMAYLCDRGLSTREAEQLFVRALFEDAIIHAPEAASHAAAVAQAERVLGVDVAHDFDEGIEG